MLERSSRSLSLASLRSLPVFEISMHYHRFPYNAPHGNSNPDMCGEHGNSADRHGEIGVGRRKVIRPHDTRSASDSSDRSAVATRAHKYRRKRLGKTSSVSSVVERGPSYRECLLPPAEAAAHCFRHKGDALLSWRHWHCIRDYTNLKSMHGRCRQVLLCWQIPALV